MIKRSNAIKASAVGLALALALTGCAGGEGENKGKDGKNHSDIKGSSFNPQPYDKLKDGGTLSLSLGEVTPQLNVFHANMTSDTSTVWSWYNPQIIKFEADGTLKPNPNYLTSVKDEVKDGKTVVTYKIHEKAVFNDGTPIDYKSWVNTWNANKGDDPAYEVNSSDGYDKIESVERGANDKEVIVTFKVANPWWGGVFNYILHPAVDSAEKFDQAYLGEDLASAHPEWGAGPYKLESLSKTPGVVTFVRNENWWGPKGKLDKITYTQRESAASLNAFKNGETDVTGASTAERYKQVNQMGDTVDIRKGSTTATRLLTLNSKSEVLSDIKVREAIANAIDKPQLQQVMFAGLDGYSEEPTGSLILFNYQEGYEDNFGKLVPKQDLEKAGKLLDEAGWTKGADGMRAKDGQPLSVRIPLFGDNTTVKNYVTTLQAQLKAAGIDLQIQARPSSEFSTVIKNRDFDILSSGFASTDPYGVAYFCQIYCTDSGLNKSGTGTKEFDEKIKTQLETLPTADEQIKKANELEKEALAQYGMIPIYSGPDIVAVKKGLANVGAGLFAQGIADFKENIGWVEGS